VGAQGPHPEALSELDAAIGILSNARTLKLAGLDTILDSRIAGFFTTISGVTSLIPRGYTKVHTCELEG